MAVSRVPSTYASSMLWKIQMPGLPVIGIVAALLCSATARAQLPAFPGAEGAGALAVGGRRGDVYRVVNLNNSGAGSFRYGVTTGIPANGRTIVFDVSGYVTITGDFTIAASKLTIAGQTAPGDGFGIKGGTVWITGDDVVVRNIRFRAPSADCLDLDSGASNVVMDRCSFEFSKDENLSTWNPPQNFTMQWSFNAWGLFDHSCGGLWNGYNMTSHHSLWAHNHTRDPKARATLLDWINNITFDYGIGFIMGDSATPANWNANVIGNYFLCPPGNVRSYALSRATFDRYTNYNFSVYQTNNLTDNDGDGLLDGTDKGWSVIVGDYRKLSNKVVMAQGVAVTVDPPLTAYKKILSQAGPVNLDANSSRPLRDEVDTLLVGSVMARLEQAFNSVSDTGLGNGGFGTLNSTPPPVDTDKDGMPDFWEDSVGLNPAKDDHTNQVPAAAFITNSPAGYTALEEYLHWLATPHGFVLRDQPLSVDLRRFTMGFTNRSPVYSVSGASNGTVTITNSVYGRFWPASNFFGRANFLFAVNDADGSSWTQKFLVCVSPSAPPKSVIWRGDGTTNRWDNFTTANWNDGISLVTFGPGDTVLMDDSGSNTPAIFLAHSLLPAAVTIAADQNYTLAGTGSLGGAMSLTKTGDGTLNITNSGTSTYGGGTFVEGGKLALLSSTALASGLGTNFVSLTDAELSIFNGGLGLPGSGTLPNDLRVYGASKLSMPPRGTFSGDVSGGGVLNLVVNYVRGDLSGKWSAFTGELHVASGGIGGATADFRIFNSGGYPGATLFLSNNIYAYYTPTLSTGLTMRIGELHGASLARLYGADAGPFRLTWEIGGLGGDSDFAGTIQEYAADSITALTKVGGGSLVLGGAGNSYDGPTIVSNGTLIVNGATGTGAVRVVAGTLGGTGRVNGTTTLLAGTTLAPGNSAGALSISNGLSISNVVFQLELSTSPGGTNDQIALTNSVLRMYGTNDVQLSFTGGHLGSGTYALVRGGTQTVGSAANLRLSGVAAGSRQQINLSTPTGQILLNVTGSVQSLVWRGTNGSAWDYNATTNWLNATNAPDTFFNFDAVRFDDSSTNGTVTISNSVSPRAVVFATTTLFYSVYGAAISGTATLEKFGPRGVTLHGSNSFSGGTFLHGGNLYLGNDTANASGLGSGPVTFNGGTLRMYDDDSTYNNASWDLVIPAAATGTLYADGRCDLYGDVSGGGTFNVFVNFVRTTIFGNWSSFTGRLNIVGDGDYSEFRIGPDYAWPGLGGAHVDLVSNAVFKWTGNLNGGAGSICALGMLSGDATALLLGGPIGGRKLTYRIGGRGGDALYAGRIAEQTAGDITAIEKWGGGVWTLSGTNAHTGGTTVKQGTLIVNTPGGSGTGSGGVSVESGARVGGGGIIGGELNLANGATLAPGATNQPGTLTIDDAASIASGANLHFRLGATSDSVIVNGTLQLGGQITLSNSGGFAGGIFPLFTYGGDLDLATLTLASAPTGYIYSIETNTPGIVNLHALTPFMQWQLANFGSLTNPNALAAADHDGDGFSNESEYRAGTQPTNSASLLALVSGIQSGTNIVLNWKTAGIRTNYVQVSSGSFTNFTDASGPIVINGIGDATTNVNLPAPTNGSLHIYRIRVP